MEVADITGIILTKLDGTAKEVSLSRFSQSLEYRLNTVGIGEKIDDLQKFDANDFVNALFKRPGGKNRMSGEYEEQVKGEKMEDMEEKEEKLTLEKFEEATEAVSKVISETKLVYSEHFSNMTGNKVYFKPENMQYTGAYKVRGALLQNQHAFGRGKSRGLITASAGNHAQESLMRRSWLAQEP